MTTLTASESITYQVNKFIEYVKSGSAIDEAFEIAFDFIAEDGIITKEEFLNKCQNAAKKMSNLNKAYLALIELSKTNGNAAIARPELYYANNDRGGTGHGDISYSDADSGL